MIRTRIDLQVMECEICGEMVEIRRKTLADPETVLIMVQQLQVDHQPCEEFKDDPGRARLERGYRVRMRDELRKNGRRRRG